CLSYTDPFGLCPDERQKNTICMAFFIQGETAGPLKGDGRGFRTSSDPSQSRAYIVIDLENNTVLDKGVSPTCTAGGRCREASRLSQIGASFDGDGNIHVSVLGHNSMTIVRSEEHTS